MGFIAISFTCRATREILVCCKRRRWFGWVVKLNECGTGISLGIFILYTSCTYYIQICRAVCVCACNVYNFVYPIYLWITILCYLSIYPFVPHTKSSIYIKYPISFSTSLYVYYIDMRYDFTYRCSDLNWG